MGHAYIHHLTNCKGCPNLIGTHTPGSGYADDWYCSHKSVVKDLKDAKVGKYISGYIEWSSDEPESVPKWCPLPTTRELMFKLLESEGIEPDIIELLKTQQDKASSSPAKH